MVQRGVEALGVTCRTYTVDVADEPTMKALADAVDEAVGAPDVLINNAGIGHLGPFLKSDLAHWPRILGVNLMGVVHGCYHFIPKMLAAGGPRQVLIVRRRRATIRRPRWRRTRRRRVPCGASPRC